MPTPFEVGVLLPGNFGRYNDGIIQAALLRAALPHELNYGPRPDLSREMRRIIERAIARHRDNQGEAALEFLFAVASGRLTLEGTDLERLKTAKPPADCPELLAGWLHAVRRI